jgi:hypothetical protein
MYATNEFSEFSWQTLAAETYFCALSFHANRFRDPWFSRVWRVWGQVLTYNLWSDFATATTVGHPAGLLPGSKSSFQSREPLLPMTLFITPSFGSPDGFGDRSLANAAVPFGDTPCGLAG